MRESILEDLITKKETLENTISQFKTYFSDPKSVGVNSPNNNGILNNSIFHENVIESMLIEISQGNVPFYFTLISNKQLFDFTNQLIPKNGNVRDNIITDNLDVKSDTEDFFPVPCHTYIFARFNDIVKNIEIEKQQLNKELKDSVERLRLLDSSQMDINIEVVRNLNQQFPRFEDSNNRINNSGCCRLM